MTTTNEIITTKGVLLNNQGIQSATGLEVVINGDLITIGSSIYRIDEVTICRVTKRLAGPGGWEILW